MESHEEMPRQSISISNPWGLTALVLALILCATAGASLFYFVREHRQARDLAATNQALNANLAQMQNQLQALSEKFNALTEASQSPAPTRSMSSASPASSMPPHAMSKRVHARAAAHQLASRQKPDDPRFNQMQQQLSEQEKQLAATREDMEKTRNDFDGKLNSTRTDLDGRLTSTRDELNGSIARTHDQLVALEKRGERNYYEFKLDKSKNFRRVGPISLALRKVNYKHKSYNLSLMVDDFKLDKKNINLYEPVWITLTDRPQPVELVVNRVSKDQVTGYLSESKYKKSELSASAATLVAKPAPADKAQSAATQNTAPQSAAPQSATSQSATVQQ
jgi:septal ring factor EnvC (AmiA/AmiB activator)